MTTYEELLHKARHALVVVRKHAPGDDPEAQALDIAEVLVAGLEMDDLIRAAFAEGMSAEAVAYYANDDAVTAAAARVLVTRVCEHLEARLARGTLPDV